jgi:hypothetical protein
MVMSFSVAVSRVAEQKILLSRTSAARLAVPVGSADDDSPDGARTLLAGWEPEHPAG